MFKSLLGLAGRKLWSERNWKFKTALIGLPLVALVTGGAYKILNYKDYDSQRLTSDTTAFKLFGKNHKVVSDSFDIPNVEGLKCVIGRPKTGGVSGSLGLAEDLSSSDVDCDQIGPIVVGADFKNGQEVFAEDRNVGFKSLKVTISYFPEIHGFLVHSFTKHVVDGSAKFGQEQVTAKAWINEDGTITQPDLGPLSTIPKVQ